MGRLFGTDGARGVANSELTCELAMNIGRAAAMVLAEASHRRARIIIGKDTRISSDMLESALIAGICSVGADALTLGVIPTPAVAYLVKRYSADAGVMISASHNPVEYNGIKIFSGEGYKLSDPLEEKIESIVIDGSEKPPVKEGTEIGRVIRQKNAVDDYVTHLAQTVGGRLEPGLSIAVDCANGSASATAPYLFARLGVECEIINAHPDGTNINAGCGSTHIEALSRFVRENDCDVGVAFDGDADRCLAVDEEGRVIDGDRLIAVFAKALRGRGRLPHDTAVVTMLSNMGFFKFAEKYGINVSTTNVGDRNVLENMLEHGYSLGGEQSGHIIFLDHATTGDGEITAIQFLSILLESGLKASQLASVMECYPQVMVNVHVGAEGKAKLKSDEEISAAVKAAEAKLNGDGRVIVRASGTEPLVRVMLEGRDRAEIDALAGGIADVVKKRLG
jgi:phosphoglucosamine mutase